MHNHHLQEIVSLCAEMNRDGCEVDLEKQKNLLVPAREDRTPAERWRRNIAGNVLCKSFNRLCEQLEKDLLNEGWLPHLEKKATAFVETHRDLWPIVLTADKRSAVTQATKGMLALHFITAANILSEMRPPKAARTIDTLTRHILYETKRQGLHSLISMRDWAEAVENTELLPVPVPVYKIPHFCQEELDKRKINSAIASMPPPKERVPLYGLLFGIVGFIAGLISHTTPPQPARYEPS